MFKLESVDDGWMDGRPLLYYKHLSHLVNRRHMDRKIAAESYLVMKVGPAAARGSRERCMGCIKCTMTARLADMYRTINGHHCTSNGQVPGKKRKSMSNCQNILWLFEEHFCTGEGETGKPRFIIPRRCKSSVWSHGPPFHTRYSLVSMRSLSVIVSWKC